MTPTKLTPAPLAGLYAQPDFILSRGEGCWLWDEDGRRYLDFTAGIAVNALGYGSPVVAEALRQGLASGLVHTSNLFATRPAMELAHLLVEHSFPGKVFFCNSGAEANEAALKFARRWAGSTGAADKTDFVAFRGAFHGRLMGSLAATDREAYQAPFRPLMPGVHFLELGDEAGLEALLAAGRVAAVLLEPVQGEGGVLPVPAGFLRSVRELCDRFGSLLVFDEVQCGLGRTGKLFAHQHAGVTPDLMTLAKPLAGGLPMGAVIARDEVTAALRPGDHGTTFGGGPLVATVALALLRTVSDPAFLAGVAHRGRILADSLEGVRSRVPSVQEVRGMGLMQGLVLDGEAAPVVAKARAGGLLVVSAGPKVVRLLPPLVVSEDELAQGVAILEAALA